MKVNINKLQKILKVKFKKLDLLKQAITHKSYNSNINYEILEFLKDKIVSWWMPDDVVFVDSLPHTATGKIQKLALREQFKDYKF